MCYYEPLDDDDEVDLSYWATYAIYRAVDSSSISPSYVRVSEMFRAVRTTDGFTDTDSTGRTVSDGEIRDDYFTCFTDALESAPVWVHEGDVVGACVFKPMNGARNSFIRRQLDVVGETESSRESLLEMPANVCDMDEIPSVVPASQLSNRNRRRLHIYANIGIKFTLLNNPRAKLITNINALHPSVAISSPMQVTTTIPPINDMVSTASTASNSETTGIGLCEELLLISSPVIFTFISYSNVNTCTCPLDNSRE